jgi:hypothetical protein
MRTRNDEFRTSLKPVEPYVPPKLPTPAPAWVALVAAWAGLLMLIASVVFVFLPGTGNPRQDLERRDFAPADLFLPVPVYGIAVAMFLGIVVLWQMRKEPRPLPQPMLLQRLQAWIGVVLALLGAVIIYADVALRGPK